MRNLKLYIAISLNGKIARTDGQVDWLEKVPHEGTEDYGYAAFYEGIDTTIMGNNTYKEVLGFDVDFPYTGKKNYVFTRNTELNDDENVTYVSEDIISFVRDLKGQKGKDVWLVGGGQLNTAFFNANLIDELVLHIMPIVIPDGIEFLPSKPIERLLDLKSSRSYKSGVVELIYKL